LVNFNGAAMTWKVKIRQPDESIAKTLKDDALVTARLYDEEKAKGREVWIEDHQGRSVRRESLGA
jgi:predicted transcriptional regulator